MENVELLKGYTNEQNAVIVDNYPYGSFRTLIKFWIETTNKGDRFVSQTLNPKTQRWNNPKKSTYMAVMVMYKNLLNSHVSYFGLYFTTVREEILKFEESTKGFIFSEAQQKQLRLIKAYSKAYESVEYVTRTRKFKNKKTGEIKEVLSCFELDQYIEVDEEGNEINKEQEELQQEQTKKNISNSVKYHYIKQDF